MKMIIKTSRKRVNSSSKDISLKNRDHVIKEVPMRCQEANLEKKKQIRHSNLVPHIILLITTTYIVASQSNCHTNYNDSIKLASDLVSTTADLNESDGSFHLGGSNELNNQQPHQISHLLLWDDLLQDDDEEEDDDENEETDEEENFYSPNDSKSGDLGADIKVSNSDFKDFDDHEAMRTSEFYSNAKKVSNGTNPKKRDKPSARKSGYSEARGGQKRNRTVHSADGEYQAAESYAREKASGAECALMLERGGCITYGAVEWAIRRARNIIDFEQPDDINSLEPSEASVNAVGELNELTTRILAKRFQLSWLEVASELSQIDVRRTSLWRNCPLIYRISPACLAQSRYRTHNGLCNNLLAPYLGSSYMPFSRALPADYADAVGLPRRSSSSGAELPPARLLALYLHPEIENPSGELSVLFMSWGQLVNHDLAMASGARPETGHRSQCCKRSVSHRLCMPILIGPDDPVYAPFGVQCLDFKRSLAGLRPFCSLGPRIQLNTITSFVDASFVYGSRISTSARLRSFRRGLLRTWQYFRPPLKPLLPAQRERPDEECRGRRGGRFCFLSGDSRTNQQIQLAALHTYHARQHNRLAGALRVVNPHWSDERLYQEARHIHIALVQHILLSEYLPLLLGPKLAEQHGLLESPFGEHWDHYSPQVNPSISQAFAAAAFRQGHSSVPSEVFRFNALHEPTRVYQLRELFRQPWPLFEPGSMDEFLLGMLDAPAQSFDPFVSSELSGHLLEEPGERVGLDLVAMNIQRSRDQGVAGYNAFRDWCGLPRANSFDELAEFMDNRTSFLLGQLYESVEDVDLFSGGLSEHPLEGALVGPTFGCIIGRQFEQLRLGDRFWFESSLGPQAFSLEQLESIKQVSLARLLCANADQLLAVQQWALRQPHPVLNPRLPCSELPDLDMSLWQEPPPPRRPPSAPF